MMYDPLRIGIRWNDDDMKVVDAVPQLVEAEEEIDLHYVGEERRKLTWYF